jgi:hypothetical protein
LNIVPKNVLGADRYAERPSTEPLSTGRRYFGLQTT